MELVEVFDDPIQRIMEGDPINDHVRNIDDVADRAVDVEGYRRRVFAIRATFELPAKFRERFRMWPAQADALLAIIGPRLIQQTQRSRSLNPKQKLMIALRFYASNSFYYSIGDCQGVTKSTSHGAIRQVTEAANELLFPEIRWPATADARRALAAKFFYRKDQRIPFVCDTINGTLIPVTPPEELEQQFVDRHGNHTVNVMAVSDAEYRVLYLSARWPGSVSDARVLRTSSLAEAFDRGWRPFENAVLLGDSIYPVSDWLIPMCPTSAEERRDFYNAHAITRSVIECTFGIAKNRFYALRTGLRVRNVNYACDIIKAGFALHNFCIEHNVPNNFIDLMPPDTDVALVENPMADGEAPPTAANHPRLLFMLRAFNNARQ